MGYWQGQPLYGAATVSIFRLGELMGTADGVPPPPPPDTPCGTGGGAGNAGFTEWMEPYPAFIVNDHLTDGDFSPTFLSVSKSLIGGNLGTVGRGRYIIVGDIKGIPVIKRKGGHAVTVVRARRDANGSTMWVRDPADDSNDLTTQSPFVSRLWTITEMMVIRVDNKNQPIGSGVMSVVNFPSDDGALRIIDGHRTLRTVQGYSLENDGHSLGVLAPDGFLSPQSTSFPSPNDTLILDAAAHWDLNAYFVVSEGELADPNTLHLIETLTSTSQVIGAVDDPQLVVVGRKQGRVYTYDTFGQLASLIVDSDGGATVGVTVSPPFEILAAAFDDATDEVVLLSVSDHKLIRYPDELTGPPTTEDIPGAVPLGGAAWMAIDPLEPNKVWVLTEASDSIFGLFPGIGGGLMVEQISLPQLQSPAGLDMDNTGRLYTIVGGQILVLMQGVGGGWLVDSEAAFGGLAAQGLLHIVRNRTNAGPIHDGPEWLNIDTDELLIQGDPVPDCVADIDADGFVGITDFLFLLGAWGPCPEPCPPTCPADLDGDCQVGITDFLKLLASWGQCF